jgi:TolA-binding protein
MKTRSTSHPLTGRWGRLSGLILLAVALSRFCFALPDSPADPQEILTAGKAALEDGLYEVAQKQFELYVERTGGISKVNEDAVVLLLRSLHQQKKYEEILNLLKGRQGPDKPPLGGAVQYWRALALYETGKPDEALAGIGDFEKRFAGSEYLGRAERLRAWCYLKTGKPELALEAFVRFDKTSADSPEGPANLLEWGKVLIAAGRLDDARPVLDRLSRKTPDSDITREGSYWLGQVLLKQRKFDEALALVAPLSTNESVREDLKVESLFAVAEVHEGRTNIVEAVAVLSNGLAQARSPELKLKGTYNLGRVYLEQGRLEEGIPLLKSFISSKPGDPRAEEAQLKLANALLDRSRNPDAVNEYQYYLETFTNSAGQAQARFGRGWGLMNIGRYAEAATEFAKAYGLSTEVGRKEQCLFKMGDAYFANSQFKLAAETYERITTEFPKSKLLPNVFFQLGESLTRAEDPQKAEKKFMELIRKYPDGPYTEEALLRLGEIKRTQSRWQESLEDFDKIINVHSNSPFLGQALHGRGIVYYNLFRFGEARADFDRVLRSYTNDPSAEQAFYMRGLCDYGMGKDEQALVICNDFIKLYPESKWTPDVVFWIAKYEYNQGNYESAEKRGLQLAEKYRNSPLADSAVLLAGQAAFKRKEYLRAVDLFTKMVKEYPASRHVVEARFAQADALSELANYPAAILIYEEIIIKYQDSELAPAAWCRKGDCQFTLGTDNRKRYEEAIESYRVVVNSSAAGPDLAIQSKYKIGRCLEKLDRTTEAFEQYYLKVMVPYLDERAKGVWHTEACKLWFTRAAFNAADIMEAKKDWNGVVSILERAVSADVPAAAEAKERIKKIKSEHWWNFLNSPR